MSWIPTVLDTVSHLFNIHFPLLCWLNFDFIWGVTVSGWMLASAPSLKARGMRVMDTFMANGTHARCSWERLYSLGKRNDCTWQDLSPSSSECGHDVWISSSHMLNVKWQTQANIKRFTEMLAWLLPATEQLYQSDSYFQLYVTLPHLFIRESSMLMKSRHLLCFRLQGTTVAAYVTSHSCKARKPLKSQNHMVVNHEAKENVSFSLLCLILSVKW